MGALLQAGLPVNGIGLNSRPNRCTQRIEVEPDLRESDCRGGESMETCFMIRMPFPFFVSCCAVITGGILASCSLTRPTPPVGSFASVRPVLERNCLHCHGVNKLPHMPSLADTAEIAKLKGPGKWIMPGQPENSRIYQVVTAADTTPNAMPPTGHAISAAEVGIIRAWIKAGAPLPADAPVVLTPIGEALRSR